jgi:hypothetical protein
LLGDPLWRRCCLLLGTRSSRKDVTIPPLVLVIDDSGDTREVYAVLLRLEGFSVEGASDGREGLRKARGTSARHHHHRPLDASHGWMADDPALES